MYWPFIVVVIFVGFLILIIKKPDLLKNLISKLKREKEESESSENRVPYPINKSLTERFMELNPGDFVSFGVNPFTFTGTKDFPLEGKGVLYCLHHKLGDFRRKGGEYSLLDFDDGIFFIKRPEGWYGFNQSTVFLGEEVNIFNEAGEVFSKKGQKPRCHSFEWEGKTLCVLDVGYLEYQHQNGRTHLESGNMVKYLLAEEKKGDETIIYFLENLKGETGTDQLWTGKYFGKNFDTEIVDIFPRGK